MAKRKVLVVEDDRGIRDHLAERLEDYEVTFATCQADAYAHLASAAFDLVLLDLRLPRDATDLRPVNQVGIDILKEIRKRELLQRGSRLLLPVVVMTAFGCESLTADVLVRNGANDYIPKPFGKAADLELKIQHALAGTGALVPAANIVGDTVRVAFNEEVGVARVETISYRRAHFGLLKALGNQYVEDFCKLLAPESFNKIPARALAQKLDITEQAVRRRVQRLRQQLAEDFRTELGRSIGDHHRSTRKNF